MELHQLISVSRRFRRNVGFAGPFIADHHACRRLAHRIGLAARARGQAEPPPRPSHLYALFLIEEILRYVVHLFLDQMNPELFADLDKWVEKEQGPAEPLAKEFRLAFFLPGRPAPAADLKTFMSGRTLGMPNRHLLLRELLLLRTGTLNPAYRPFQDIFDDSRLEEAFSYRLRVSGWQPFFEEQPRFGPDQQSLPEMLHSPAAASPHSLFGQLEFMLRHWGSLLGRYRDRLLQALDFLREEDRMRGGGPGPARVLDFEGLEGEFYSPDREWMPRVVLIAKSALVWLQQLSVRYSRAVDRLDQIPDEELDLLAGRGFNALWLIGIWERSPASQRIKRRCGNPEAEASAYSLKTYGVADFLGGEAALENLKSRCSARGIRLACDMVPNHTGLDAPWVYDHPDWFVQVQHPPFPAYSFNGENLADRPGFGLYLEDHYYDRSDAAVVFKWVRFDGGETRYLYHGNDGTHLPWNDTAQLNYLLPEVREAVMSSILDTARRFSIIRFDAAMTLTRKHFQRLWFPEPGGGGDIPSRSEHGLGRRDFMQRMPAEFWRQVVDRVAQEAPDTLLLAEAFWLMEGYFVRTLGMHRVYNSAFMNMLKMEENWKYRTLIKNTLEFDPQILKRYVNFMNNPDEETAVAQFGKGDKYFGVCLMMATLPGLPLFGHGQVEGFREKYGMEYRRAYWNEEPDPELIRRHEQLIFPLLRRRALFAGVEHFALYDLFTEEGKVNENVFAYSNGEGGERSLVVYNNRFEQARGWIRVSCAFTEKDPGSGERRMRQKKLAEALGLSRKPRAYVRFREHASRLHYLRSCRRLWDEGFFLELGAYHFQVFLDFQEKEDDARGLYRELERTLGGRGVADLEACLKEVELRPLFEGFRALCSADLIRQAREGEAGPAPGGPKVRPLAGPKVRPKDGAKVRPKDGAAIEGLGSNASALFEAAAPFLPEGVDKDKAAARAAAEVPKRFNRLWPRISRAASLWGEARLKWPVLIAWAVVSGLENGLSGAGAARDNGWLLEAWRLKRPLQEAWSGAGLAGEEAEDSLRLLGTLLRRMPGGRAPASRTSVRGGRPEARDLLPALLQEAEVRGFLKVHEHQGAQWFGQERMETLAGVLVRLLPAAGISGSASPLLKGWLELSASAGYHWDRFLEAAHGL